MMSWMMSCQHCRPVPLGREGLHVIPVSETMCPIFGVITAPQASGSDFTLLSRPSVRTARKTTELIPDAEGTMCGFSSPRAKASVLHLLTRSE